MQWLTNTGMSSSDIIEQWLALSSSEQYVKSAIVQHLELLVDTAFFYIKRGSPQTYFFLFFSFFCFHFFSCSLVFFLLHANKDRLSVQG
jgi:hypothetical protein